MIHTLVILGIICWCVCGVVSQGMCRYNFAQTVSPEKKWGPNVSLLTIIAILGPGGLLICTIICAVDNTWGLKFKYDK